MKTQPSPQPSLKAKTRGALALAALFLTGCVVTSVYPFYAAKDVTFDAALLGTWGEPDETEANRDVWTFTKTAAPAYKLSVRNGSSTNEFDAHLFTLGGQKFLDCLPCERHAYTAPAHVLLRVNRLQPQLEMQLLDYKWLCELVATQPKAVRHLMAPAAAGASPERDLLILTAETPELQKFIRKHLNNTNAWIETMVMKKE